ncbi:galactoside alpha-(1,2)-fucosyltransferase 2-like [Pollicipes pollicipes]|uniref:galactoside alpha-(1,2)-fucosyltransferase 2-like n=1 Tax=Pollicipes pollicipes TaxID=41117 RepID=UPI00188532C8|nr:galactoside alpha-(1,2)-fucosyltransferase 2-like [Pollicipes pollicipes]
MNEKLNLHFDGRRHVAPLSARCAAAVHWRDRPLGDEATFAEELRAGRSLRVAGGPCPLSRFYARRAAVLAELPWRTNIWRTARRRLERTPPGTRTYIGVHVRRTDYEEWLATHLDGRLVSPVYLQRALRYARHAYPRPAFLVSSDDMVWCREHIVGTDVVFVGSDASEAVDLATLALCNHTILTYGTFGYVSAFLAGGDVLAPTGYSRIEYFLTNELRWAGRNITLFANAPP